MKYNDNGPEVKQLQQALIQAGYDLSKFGADGNLGRETFSALQDFASDNKLVWTPEIPESVVAALTGISVPFYDLTADPAPFSANGKFNIRHGEVVKRPVSMVNGITISLNPIPV